MNYEWMAKYRQNILLIGVGSLILILFYFAEHTPGPAETLKSTSNSDSDMNKSQLPYRTEKVTRPTGIKYSSFKRNLDDQTVHTFHDFFESLKAKDDFAVFFADVLKKSPYKAFFFECPALMNQFLKNSFEFVLTESITLASVRADTDSFKEHFSWKSGKNFESIVFKNLGGDASLVVPYPSKASLSEANLSQKYAHFASFLRNSTSDEVLDFLSLVGATMLETVSQSKIPVWLSTAGTGVFWLHVRLDARPKYYTYAPYTHAEYLQKLSQNS